MSRRRFSPVALRRGFTLVELGVSTSIVGVLMVSMASVVVLTSKALPDPNSAAEVGGANAMALDQLMAELRCATKITSATAAGVEFEVADRDNDTNPETIRYAWAGSGAALVRAYNGGTAVAVSGPLRAFSLDYSRRKETRTTSTKTVWDSGEVLLSSFNGWLGLTVSTVSQPLSATSWASETFSIDRVSLPADTTRLAISRVSVQVRRPSSYNGTTYSVAIHRPSAAGSSIPQATPVGTPCSLQVAPLGTLTYSWVDATFSDVVFPDANQTAFCIVVKGTGSSSAILRYLNLTTAPSDAYVYRYTTDSGSNWQPTSSLNSSDMTFFVYGSYQRETVTSASADVYFLTSARATLQSGPAWASRLDSGVEALNRPQVPAP